jgi:acyl-CoA reductase-like NAD-dependent aldehyde dehydrogenase
MFREEYGLAVPGFTEHKPEWHEVKEPYSGNVMGKVELLSEEGLNAALDIAGAASARHALAPYERARILKAVSQAIAERAEHFALLIAREGGKPLQDARVEVERASQTLLLCSEEATRNPGREIPMGSTPRSHGRLAMTTREPIGVVLAFSAFNHPLNLLAHQVGPAVAAGCPVLIKPAPATPICCMALVELFREAGLPDELLIPIPCTNEQAAQLAGDSRMALFSFIGSSKVGWKLRSTLAPGVRCVLEHGGAAPVIVHDDADLSKVVPALLRGGYYHAGQVCVSVQRVFAHHHIKRELVDRLNEGAAELIVGDPTDEKTQVGPLIRAQEIERINAWAGEADKQGGEITCGGRGLANQCYSPTVIVDAPGSTKVMNEEIFGPVICVNGYRKIEEPVQWSNRLPWAFQAGVFTNSLTIGLKVSQELAAAAVMINDHSAFRIDSMPFGGHGESGLTLGGVAGAVKEMSREKMIVFKS